MTTVTFYRLPDGRFTGFEMRGHAGYARSGRDIVCSALSVAGHMAYAGLSEVQKLPLEAEADEKTGLMQVSLSEENVGPAQIMLETLHLEISLIAEQYPDHVKINYAGRREIT